MRLFLDPRRSSTLLSSRTTRAPQKRVGRQPRVRGSTVPPTSTTTSSVPMPEWRMVSVPMVAVLALMVSSCAVLPPPLNPSPQAVLRVEGTKFAGLMLRFRMTYSTTNKQCETRPLPTAPTLPHHIYEVLEVSPDATDFVLEIPLDKYVPGECAWQANFVEFSNSPPSSRRWSPVVWFSQRSGQKAAKVEYVCYLSSISGDGSCRMKDQRAQQPAISPNGGAITIAFDRQASQR